MKLIAFTLAVVSLSAFVLADQAQFKSKLATLAASKIQAGDAVQSVLQLLNDFKQAELDEQARADQRNQTEEENGAQVVSEYNSMVENNNRIAQKCTQNREYVESQLEQATSRVTFIDGRLLELEQLIADLGDDRCQSNGLFVSALAQNRDAIVAVETLKKDFQAVLDAGQDVELSQVQSIADRIKQYENLFEESAVKSFVSLSQDLLDSQGNAVAGNGYVDPVTGRVFQDTRSIPERVFRLVLQLQVQLQSSINDIESNEIQAAYQFKELQESVAAESNTLKNERAQKVTLIDKLGVELDLARDYEGRCYNILKDTQRALNAALEDLEHRRSFYQAETQRRNDEIKILNEVIRVFRAKIGKLQEYLNQLQTEESN